MRKNIFKILSIIMIISMLTALCGCGEKATSAPETETVSNTQSDLEQSSFQETDMSESAAISEDDAGFVTKFIKFESDLSQSGGGKYNIFFRYREGSQLIAEITGSLFIPTERADYAEFLAEDKALYEKAKKLNSESPAIVCSEQSGGMNTIFAFTDLDIIGNNELVDLAVEYFGQLISKNGVMYLEENANILTSYGFEIVDKN